MNILHLQAKLEAYLATVPGTVCVAFHDLTTGESFDLQGKKSVHSASTIKLLILAELMDQVRLGRLSLSQTVTVTAEMHTGGDGILKELLPGHSFTLREIATLMIIVSDNEATNILIDLLGMDAINARAKALGLTGTILGRKMMDSEARKQGRDNYITANDMVYLLQEIYYERLIDARSSRVMLDILKRQQQSGRLQLYLPEEVLVTHKCGDLDFLENDGGIVYAGDRPYILVVLTSRMASNKEGRETIGVVSKIVYDGMIAN